MTHRRRGGGFTLVEMLVAMTVLALLFGALMPVFQQGLAVLGSGDRHTRAVLLAESLLAQAAGGFDEPDAAAAPPLLSGSEGELNWQLERAPFVAQGEGAALPVDAPLGLVHLRATVSWDGGGAGVSLSTLALERRP